MKICLNETSSGDFFRKTAIIKNNQGEVFEIYFKFPCSVKAELTERADPFVFALAFIMMEEGGCIEIDGQVSRSVADNIVMFSRIWSIWWPEHCQPITIAAHIVEDDYRPQNRNMITAFSGGLDASYTAYKYKNKLDDQFIFNLDKSILILGADIPVEDKASFEDAFRSAKEMTDDLSIHLIVVETNIRKFLKNWSYAFGSVIAGTLNFFSKSCFYGAASDCSVHHYPLPWGMNPITDQYLSSDSFRFISDGREHSRTDRAAIIKSWDVGLKNLRVCWSNNDKSKNCGYCEKCVRTKLNFMAVGVNHLPSMPNDLTIQELERKNLIREPHSIAFFSEIYDYGLAHKTLSCYWLNVLSKQLQLWSGACPDTKNTKTIIKKAYSINALKYLIMSRIAWTRDKRRHYRSKLLRLLTSL